MTGDVINNLLMQMLRMTDQVEYMVELTYQISKMQREFEKRIKKLEDEISKR